VGMASAAAMVLAALTLTIVLLQRRFGVSEKGWYS
jgi:multiple sugar transport system permease protein